MERGRIDLLQVAKLLKSSGLIGNRRYLLHTYKECFVARDFVSWVAEMHSVSRPEATTIGMELVECGYIHHVVGGFRFADEYLFFRIRSDLGEDVVDSDLQKAVQLLRGAGLLGDHKFLMKTYRDCFVARDAVSVLSEAFGQSRAEAVAMGALLSDKGFIRHVFGLSFADGYLFFRFVDQNGGMLCEDDSTESDLQPTRVGTRTDPMQFVSRLLHRFGAAQCVVFHEMFPKVQLDGQEPFAMAEVLVLSDRLVVLVGGEVGAQFNLEDLVASNTFMKGQSLALICRRTECFLGVRGSGSDIAALNLAVRSASTALLSDMRAWLLSSVLHEGSEIPEKLCLQLQPYEDTDVWESFLNVVALRVASESHIVDHLVQAEVARTLSRDVLFRENSRASFLLTLMIQRCSGEYLEQTVFKVISDGGDNGLVLAQRVFHLLPLELAYLPNCIRAAWNCVAKSSDARFPGSSQTILGNFVFLRFICLVLLDPIGWGFKGTVQPERAATLRRASKLLQWAATGFTLDGDIEAGAFVRETQEGIQHLLTQCQKCEHPASNSTDLGAHAIAFVLARTDLFPEAQRTHILGDVDTVLERLALLQLPRLQNL